MVKLFWKFFFFILLAQLTASFGIGGTLWLTHLRQQTDTGPDRSPPATFSLEAAASTLQHGGAPALRALLAHMGPFVVYAVDAAGRDIANRPLSPETLAAARPLARQVTAPDGRRWLLFSAHRPNGQADRQPPRNGQFGPLLPLLTSVLASLLFAALLARYFFRPIRQLRDAFSAVASGNLRPHLQQAMGARHDALADLGREFDRMAQQLQTLIEGQRRLLHHVSHELRSPLARQQIAIGLARQQPDRSADLLERIERDNQRMDKLVGAVLTLSRLESEPGVEPRDDIVLDDLLAEIVNDARFEGAPAARQVVLVGESGTIVAGSAELLHSALENIVRNAVKHTAPASTVTVRVAIDGSGKHVCVSVIDRGPGVPDADLEAIFQPFFRGAESAGAVAGHGLGLTIARQIIRGHGGQVRAFNEPDGGLRVETALPIQAS